MDAIRTFRISDPFLFLTVLWLLSSIFFFLRGRYDTAKLSRQKQLLAKLSRFIAIGLTLIIASYIALVIAYILSNTFFDQAEPNIAAVSWLVKTGQPLF